MIIEHEKHSYEVVDAVPAGYRIWNIGKHAPPNYVPLCETLTVSEDDYRVNPATLKAVKVDNREAWEAIMGAAGWGGETLETAERIAESIPNDVLYYHAKERVKKALPYLRQIKWEARK